MKLEINRWEISEGKITSNVQTKLSNQRVKKKKSSEIRKHSEINKNEDKAYQNFRRFSLSIALREVYTYKCQY